MDHVGAEGRGLMMPTEEEKGVWDTIQGREGEEARRRSLTFQHRLGPTSTPVASNLALTRVANQLNPGGIVVGT